MASENIKQKVDMGQVIKPKQVEIVTKDGECKITLSLDINLNINSTNINVEQNNSIKETEKPKDKDEVDWAIPDFKIDEKIKLGKEA